MTPNWLIPGTPDILSQEELSDLQQAVHPMEHCDNLDVSVYVMTREIVYACSLAASTF